MFSFRMGPSSVEYQYISGVWEEMQSLVLISSLDYGWDSFWFTFFFITFEPYSPGMEREEI